MNVDTGEIRHYGEGERPGPREIRISSAEAHYLEPIHPKRRMNVLSVKRQRRADKKERYEQRRKKRAAANNRRGKSGR